MADNKIMEEIFKTIDIITDYKLDATEYTYTEDCTVVSATDDPFSYKVLFQKQEYDAHSPLGEKYEVGQSVVVLFTDYSRITKKVILYGNSVDTNNIKTMNETRFLNNVRIKSQPVPINTTTGVEIGSYDPWLVFEPTEYSTEDTTYIFASPRIAIENPYTSSYSSAIIFNSYLYNNATDYVETYFPRGDLKILSNKSNPIYYNERGVSIPSSNFSPGMRISSPYTCPLDIGTSYQYFLTNFYSNNNYVGSIWTDGDNLNFYSVSDYRLKENIISLNSKESIEKIKSLNPVSFNWKRTGTFSEGFIAHEVQSIISNSVTGSKDGMKEDGSENYQVLDTAKIIPTLVSAVKELVSEIEQLKLEIEQLKGGSP